MVRLEEVLDRIDNMSQENLERLIDESLEELDLTRGDLSWLADFERSE